MRSVVILFLLVQSSLADVVVATRTIRPLTVLTAEDVTIAKGKRSDGFERIEDVIGQEARVALFAGRPLLLNSIGPPALVDRNQIVQIMFQKDGLVITTDGRSLERGGVGDRVRIMNLSSRATLFGYVQENGTIIVKQ